jgi:hypothetical protein
MRGEELIKNLKYMQNISKFDKDHMIAVTEYVFLQKESNESQGSTIASIFQSNHTKTQLARSD